MEFREKFALFYTPALICFVRDRQSLSAFLDQARGRAREGHAIRTYEDACGFWFQVSGRARERAIVAEGLAIMKVGGKETYSVNLHKCCQTDAAKLMLRRPVESA